VHEEAHVRARQDPPQFPPRLPPGSTTAACLPTAAYFPSLPATPPARAVWGLTQEAEEEVPQEIPQGEAPPRFPPGSATLPPGPADHAFTALSSAAVSKSSTTISFPTLPPATAV
jgi:hypothetical protein